MSKTYYFDCETTGISAKDELIEFSFYDADSDYSWTERVSPVEAVVDKEAEKIHGISMNDLKGLPKLEHYKERWYEHLHDNIIIIQGERIEGFIVLIYILLWSIILYNFFRSGTTK